MNEVMNGPRAAVTGSQHCTSVICWASPEDVYRTARKAHAARGPHRSEAAGAMREVMEGRAPPASLAALLSALVMKGERPAEIVGFAQTMREHAVKLVASAG